MHDLQTIVDDIKDTLSVAISELILDIRTLNDRVLNVEKAADRHETILSKAATRIDSYTLQMRDMQRHLEDLDNRGWRHNLRIRGLPETIRGDRMPPAVVSLFSSLLNRPLQTPVTMERIHQALRPKGRETDPPRDTICCIVDYKIKEEILRQARGRTQILHEGHNIQLYQDLSRIALQHRRDLKPLLDTLRSKRYPVQMEISILPFSLHSGPHGPSESARRPTALLRGHGYTFNGCA